MKSREFFWICCSSLYSNSVCVCLCWVWPERLRVICLRCTDFYPKCRDAVQCIRETLVLIYQHMVRIDNPSAPGAVGNQRERDWEAKRERKRRGWWWEKERMSLHADTLRRAVMWGFFFLFLSLSILGHGHLTRPDWVSAPVQKT